MLTFSKIQKETNNDTFVYDGFLKIKKEGDFEYLVGVDCALALVHLTDTDEILLRKEWVPSFQHKEPSQEYFLTMISGQMEEGETSRKTVIRELVEEAGVLLNTGYNGFEEWGDFFYSKNNSSMCHILYLPVTINDFRKVAAMGDGTELEKKSKTVKVGMNFLNSLKPSDLVTAYCLERLKSKK